METRMTRRVKKDGNFYSELLELFEVDTSECTNGLLIQFHPNYYIWLGQIVTDL